MTLARGRVSPAARRAYLEADPRAAGWFAPDGRGYRMYAGASEIRRARALGRGAHRGQGLPVHPFDA